MGMVMRNHELVEFGAYPYGFAPEVDAWREVAEDRNSDVSASIFVDAFELSGYLDPSVDLAGEPVMEDIVSSLLGLSLSYVQGATGELWIGGVREQYLT
ncbi:hypothetical protein AYI68_g3754 [Smittium mucronatum]|uniref:Uncharacterized protein n=1 Tax=Smittium mucronatum TaxID=133383 RepID=A0A1R0GZ03_9FUNG|nr:hypothetical protein AYI68_g3754 [Smittium mucronatum]